MSQKFDENEILNIPKAKNEPSTGEFKRFSDKYKAKERVDTAENEAREKKLDEIDLLR